MKTPYYQDDIIKICDNNHLSVDEIFVRLKKIYPNVGRSTIYRNVENMVKDGKLRKITSLWDKALFEKNKWFHIHLFDEKTKKLIDLEEEINIKLPENFEISDMEIIIKWTFNS